MMSMVMVVMMMMMMMMMRKKAKVQRDGELASCEESTCDLGLTSPERYRREREREKSWLEWDGSSLVVMRICR